MALDERRIRLNYEVGRAVSRRPLTGEARVRSCVSPCGICGGQSGTGTGFSPNTSVFPCQYHSTGAPLLRKMKKKTAHLHHRVPQEALRLRCVRSICCEALFHKKKNRVIRETERGNFCSHRNFLKKIQGYAKHSLRKDTLSCVD
jgi:hypothetical protein